MKVLITGIGGFVGSHFMEFFLNKNNIELHGIEHKGVKLPKILGLKNKIKSYSECGITDFSKLKTTLKRIKPNYIIHLAAQSSPSKSWKAPVDTVRVNIEGQVNLLEAIRSIKIDPKIIIAGSCEEYGLVKKSEIPIRETQPLRPLNTYAVSKVAQDFLGYQYYKSYGMKVIRTRPFHHTGPRRPAHFVCSSFAKQIALIEKNKQKPIIRVGNLSAKRDFTDVRDMVSAYSLIMKKGIPGEVYNISSGSGIVIKEILDILLSFTDKIIKVEKDIKRFRPNDVPVFIGDSSKLKEISGWKPEIPIEKTLKDILEYWRENV